MKWINIKDELPPVNTIIVVDVIDGYEAFDFVNEPLDNETPFQHYIVDRWRYASREELNNLLNSKG